MYKNLKITYMYTQCKNNLYDAGFVFCHCLHIFSLNAHSFFTTCTCTIYPVHLHTIYYKSFVMWPWLLLFRFLHYFCFFSIFALSLKYWGIPIWLIILYTRIIPYLQLCVLAVGACFGHFNSLYFPIHWQKNRPTDTKCDVQPDIIMFQCFPVKCSIPLHIAPRTNWHE